MHNAVMVLGAAGDPLKLNTVGAMVHGTGLYLYSYDPATDHGGNENVEAIWRTLLHLMADAKQGADADGNYKWASTFHLQVPLLLFPDWFLNH